jgi:hypothetical protein
LRLTSRYGESHRRASGQDSLKVDGMKPLTCLIPNSLYAALQQRMNAEKEGCVMNEMHVSLPETEECLKADLTRDLKDDLMKAEQNHES